MQWILFHRDSLPRLGMTMFLKIVSKLTTSSINSYRYSLESQRLELSPETIMDKFNKVLLALRENKFQHAQSIKESLDSFSSYHETNWICLQKFYKE